MKHRRDEQVAREDERMQGGRGQDDWRSDSDRSGWGRDGDDRERFGGGMRGGPQASNARGWGVGSAFEQEGSVRVSHRGKGPKGYQRSDDRIREEVCEVLTDHHEIDASEVEVNVKDGEVTLSGTVTDRRTKRLAEHVLENVSGVLDIHNTIRIAKADATAQPSAPVANGRTNGNQPRSQH